MFVAPLIVLMMAGSEPADRKQPLFEPHIDHPGYQFLVSRSLVLADLDDTIFAQLPNVWDDVEQQQLAKLSPAERRIVTLARYGLTERLASKTTGSAIKAGNVSSHADSASAIALQYTYDAKRRWSMNCFSCHGGRVLGEVAPGAPNADFDLSTLIEEVRLTKFRIKKPLGNLDVGSMFVPLSTSRGTTNAVIFGIALGAQRDKDLNIRPRLIPPKMLHHDMDAPPWWNLRYKDRIYLDAFARKEHRALMQFMLSEHNDPEFIKQFEADFKNVLTWIEKLEPPKYPGKIDQPLAARGRKVFQRDCAHCHGTYAEDSDAVSWKARIIPQATVGTDKIRHEAIEEWMRKEYRDGWFGNYGEEDVWVSVDGYSAPVLRGVWATAPYFHNGSVPTLWHVLNPSARPTRWQRPDTMQQLLDKFMAAPVQTQDLDEMVRTTYADQFDEKLIGLKFTDLSSAPKQATSKLGRMKKRLIYDTKQYGKSSAGHLYPDKLTDDEKQAVLEYLKTCENFTGLGWRSHVFGSAVDASDGVPKARRLDPFDADFRTTFVRQNDPRKLGRDGQQELALEDIFRLHF